MERWNMSKDGGCSVLVQMQNIFFETDLGGDKRSVCSLLV